MIKQHKYWSVLVVFLCCFALTSGTKLFAASPAKQLAKGIELYENNKSDEAMDYFVDVLLNGNQEQVAQANKYVNLIHEQVGGIQKPIEVDANFKEGEVKSLNQTADAAVAAAQEQARLAAEQAAAQAAAEEAAARAALEAKQQEALNAVNAQQEALNQRIEQARQEALQQAQAQRQAALDQAAALTEADLEAATTVAAAAQQVPQTAQEDLTAIEEQAAQQVAAAQQAATAPQEIPVSQVLAASQEEAAPAYALTPSVLTEPEPVASVSQTPQTSVFADLMSPDAIQARELYTRQKLDSMTAAAMEKINNTKGAHLYMRDDRPDAIDIEPEVIFEKGQFRTESLPLLNSIYELLALTQGSAYVILPPGSYTDDVTLAGIRQAMALNSYLVNRGISQGKLHYNMGLADEEPPARYANLNGLAIVFDYDAKLPTNLEKNANNETAPLLSMAVVPLCHAIDRSLGEAFAIDFSVLETISPIDNWVLQIVQHGRDGKYYIVRQLEGFTPVYHQILWNGRKGIIGPELPCGKYTAVLTATDLKGQKQTVRRRLIVKCAGDTTTDTCNACSAKKTAVTKVDEGTLNYKASRLWVKPARKMKNASASSTAVSTNNAQSTSSSSATKTVTTRTIIQEYDGDADAESAVASVTPASTSTSSSSYVEEHTTYPTNNPYDMPYEEN